MDVDPAASEFDSLDCTQGVESVGRLYATLVVYDTNRQAQRDVIRHARHGRQ